MLDPSVKGWANPDGAGGELVTIGPCRDYYSGLDDLSFPPSNSSSLSTARLLRACFLLFLVSAGSMRLSAYGSFLL